MIDSGGVLHLPSVAATTGGASSAPPSGRACVQRFDVHAHAVPAPVDDAGRAAAEALMRREGFVGTVPGAGWSVENALRFMDEQGTDLQLLSVPGALGAEQARALNERTAEIVRAHLHRFGLLAALPMDQPDQALEEVRHALDELGADGLVVATSYDGAYLGDERFEPVFAELERRCAPLWVSGSGIGRLPWRRWRGRRTSPARAVFSVQLEGGLVSGRGYPVVGKRHRRCQADFSPKLRLR